MGFLGSIIGALSSGGDDGGCDWICDNCGAYMNSQPGFSALSGKWRCKECGSWNDVSEGNIIDGEDDDDGYLGSNQYYADEERRTREEEEDLRELGIYPYDD